MKLNKMERMALGFFDDGNVERTMQRLCIAAMLCGLVKKLSQWGGQ